MTSKTKRLAETALFLAILIVFQFMTRSFTQFVTGSLVNLVLISCAMMLGLWPGIAVAAISPWLAFLLGIGPKIVAVAPCIMLGNIALVATIWLFVCKIGAGKTFYPYAVSGVAVGALLKTLVLYFSVTAAAIPLAGVPQPAAATLTAMFSWPQIVTALIGGAVATAIVPPLSKAVGKNAG